MEAGRFVITVNYLLNRLREEICRAPVGDNSTRSENITMMMN